MGAVDPPRPKFKPGRNVWVGHTNDTHTVFIIDSAEAPYQASPNPAGLQVTP